MEYTICILHFLVYIYSIKRNKQRNMKMNTSTVQDFKNGQKYLCKDFYISCNVYGINSNSYYWEIRKEHNNAYVASGYELSRSVALKIARDER